MSETLQIHDEVFDATPLPVALPPVGEEFVAEEDDNFPTAKEIVPKNPLVRHDFSKEHASAPTQVPSEIGPPHIANLRSKDRIPPTLR